MDEIKLVQVNGKDIPAHEALMVLYAGAHPQGMGYLHFRPGPLTKEEAKAVLRKSLGVDYLMGRVVKVRFEGELDFRLYDRDNGQGQGFGRIDDYLRTGEIVE